MSHFLEPRINFHSVDPSQQFIRWFMGLRRGADRLCCPLDTPIRRPGASINLRVYKRVSTTLLRSNLAASTTRRRFHCWCPVSSDTPRSRWRLQRSVKRRAWLRSEPRMYFSGVNGAANRLGTAPNFLASSCKHPPETSRLQNPRHRNYVKINFD